MIDFDIEFTSSTTFDFKDSSDYTALTVDSTELNFYYSIENGTFTNIPLHPSNVPVLGDDFTVDLTVLSPDFPYAPDGVYRFDYIVNLNGGGTMEETIYVVKYLDIIACRRILIRKEINVIQECLGCDISFLDATLNAAKDEAELGLWQEADLLIEYLKKDVCGFCDCIST